MNNHKGQTDRSPISVQGYYRPTNRNYPCPQKLTYLKESTKPGRLIIARSSRDGEWSSLSYRESGFISLSLDSAQRTVYFYGDEYRKPIAVQVKVWTVKMLKDKGLIKKLCTYVVSSDW